MHLVLFKHKSLHFEMVSLRLMASQGVSKCLTAFTASHDLSWHLTASHGVSRRLTASHGVSRRLQHLSSTVKIVKPKFLKNTLIFTFSLTLNYLQH